MKTSGVGRGGALILAAGAVAVGITGCGGSDGKKVAVQDAAAGSTVTSAATTEPTATPTASTAPATTPTTLPSTTAAQAVPTTAKPTKAPAKPTTAKPKPPATGSGWLKGVPLGHNTPGKLDPRCMTGRTICIDMSTRTLLWVVNGKVQYGMDVRFGDENNPTRKGQWTLYSKIKNCVSNLYHTPMPDAMFFSGGEAVHYSSDFAKYGYAHHSHGCVNVRDRAAVDRLFADTRVGDKVVVY
jgi:hypothetical protein